LPHLEPPLVLSSLPATCPTWALLCATALTGCSDLGNCPPDGEELTVTTGETRAEARLYQSAPLRGPLDPFPANTTVHFVHDLGFTPELQQAFVSFTATGSDSAVSPGNQTRWLCVDDHEVIVRNDTCEDFFISIAVSGSGLDHAPCTCAEGLAAGKCP